jgi:hypothetical protein
MILRTCPSFCRWTAQGREPGATYHVGDHLCRKPVNWAQTDSAQSHLHRSIASSNTRRYNCNASGLISEKRACHRKFRTSKPEGYLPLSQPSAWFSLVALRSPDARMRRQRRPVRRFLRGSTTIRLIRYRWLIQRRRLPQQRSCRHHPSLPPPYRHHHCRCRRPRQARPLRPGSPQPPTSQFSARQ